MPFFKRRRKNIHLNAGAKGDLVVSEEADVRVGGVFEGEIRVRGDLRVEKGTTLRARIEAENVRVKGKVYGDIQASKEVELSPGAELRGDVKASSLSIRKGAHFWGRCEIIAQPLGEKKKETSMSPEETAQFLEIDVNTLLQLAESKKIPALQDRNGSWCFDRVDLERWISENKLAPSSNEIKIGGPR
jgi:excisionase family DNA binding protein